MSEVLNAMRSALPRPYCTVGEAAEYLRVSPETVARMLKPADNPREWGTIRYRKIEGRKLIRLITEDVYQLLPQHQDEYEHIIPRHD